jgi:hypothetical protein
LVFWFPLGRATDRFGRTTAKYQIIITGSLLIIKLSLTMKLSSDRYGSGVDDGCVENLKP